MKCLAPPGSPHPPLCLVTMKLLYNILHRTLSNRRVYGGSTLRGVVNRKFSTCKSIKVTFLQYDEEITVDVPVGLSILEAAHRNNIEIEGACDGCMACSTCHVILEEGAYESFPEPCESELDMLDLAPCLTETSRLGCQVILREEDDGIRIKLPRVTRNFYVDGHTPAPH